LGGRRAPPHALLRILGHRGDEIRLFEERVEGPSRGKRRGRAPLPVFHPLRIPCPCPFRLRFPFRPPPRLTRIATPGNNAPTPPHSCALAACLKFARSHDSFCRRCCSGGAFASYDTRALASLWTTSAKPPTTRRVSRSTATTSPDQRPGRNTAP